jgi:hypothetical protein
MKLRLLPLLLSVLVLCSVEAAAQGRVPGRRAPVRAQATPSYGSVERTKLLDQARGRRGAQDALRLGSVQRRALLTGASVHVPKPRPRPRR